MKGGSLKVTKRMLLCHRARSNILSSRHDGYISPQTERKTKGRFHTPTSIVTPPHPPIPIEAVARLGIRRGFWNTSKLAIGLRQGVRCRVLCFFRGSFRGGFEGLPQSFRVLFRLVPHGLRVVAGSRVKGRFNASEAVGTKRDKLKGNLDADRMRRAKLNPTKTGTSIIPNKYENT